MTSNAVCTHAHKSTFDLKRNCTSLIDIDYTCWHFLHRDWARVCIKKLWNMFENILVYNLLNVDWYYSTPSVFLTCSWLLETTTPGAWLAGELSPVLLWTKHYTLTNLNQPWRLNTVKFFSNVLFWHWLHYGTLMSHKLLMLFFPNQWKLLKASIYFEAKLQLGFFFSYHYQSVHVKHENVCKIRRCVQWQKKKKRGPDCQEDSTPTNTATVHLMLLFYI